MFQLLSEDSAQWLGSTPERRQKPTSVVRHKTCCCCCCCLCSLGARHCGVTSAPQRWGRVLSSLSRRSSRCQRRWDVVGCVFDRRNVVDTAVFALSLGAAVTQQSTDQLAAHPHMLSTSAIQTARTHAHTCRHTCEHMNTSSKQAHTCLHAHSPALAHTCRYCMVPPIMRADASLLLPPPNALWPFSDP